MDISFDPVTKIVYRNSPKRLIQENSLGQTFFDCMKKNGNSVAIVEAESDQSDTYQTFLQKSIRTAMKMRELNIKPGDIICLCSYNNLNCSVPFVAAQFLGAIVATVDPTISPTDIQYLLNLIEPVMIFISDNCEEWIEKSTSDLKNIKIVSFGTSERFIPFNDFLKENSEEHTFEPYKEKDFNKTALILFSSGTTGLPKGICLTHNFVLYHSTFMNVVGTGSTFLTYATLYWISSILALTCSIIQNWKRVMCKEFNENLIWKQMEKYEVTDVLLSPVLAIKACKTKPHDLRLKHLKSLLTGGSLISKANFDLFRATFIGSNVLIGYGLTEGGMLTTFLPEDTIRKTKLYSCGLPLSGIQIKIVDPDTETSLGPNQNGEIRCKCRYEMNGYYNKDSSDCYDKDGFLKTGDMGYFDQDFCFYIIDRYKEMFKYLSWHIVPAKLESILEEHPDVKHAIVVGIPHPEEDNHATAVVILQEDSNIISKDLEKFVDERVDERNRLRGGIKITDKMPLTPTGKIMRRQLRDMIINKTIS